MHLDKAIVHFEIPANDPEKLRKFYSDCFGWEFQNARIPGFEYWLFTTGRNSPGGGMYKKQDAGEHPRNYVQVESVDAAIELFQQAGGAIIVPKQEVPGHGFTAIGVDPEDNQLGLFETVRKVRKQSRKTVRKSKRR